MSREPKPISAQVAGARLPVLGPCLGFALQRHLPLSSDRLGDVPELRLAEHGSSCLKATGLLQLKAGRYALLKGTYFSLQVIL